MFPRKLIVAAIMLLPFAMALDVLAEETHSITLKEIRLVDKDGRLGGVFFADGPGRIHMRVPHEHGYHYVALMFDAHGNPFLKKTGSPAANDKVRTDADVKRAKRRKVTTQELNKMKGRAAALKKKLDKARKEAHYYCARVKKKVGNQWRFGRRNPHKCGSSRKDADRFGHELTPLNREIKAIEAAKK